MSEAHSVTIVTGPAFMVLAALLTICRMCPPTLLHIGVGISLNGSTSYANVKNKQVFSLD